MGSFTFANMPGGVFDARNIDPAPSFVVPPLDDYMVIATASELRENAKGTGGYLMFTLEIGQGKLSGVQYQKVTAPYRLNIFHEDAQTREIAYKQLSALCHVTGVLTPNRPEDLLNKPFIAAIGPQKNNEQYSNVFGVKDLQGNTPGKKGTAAIASTPVPPAPVQQVPPVQTTPWGAQAPPAQVSAPVAVPWGPPAVQQHQAPVQQAPAMPWQPQQTQPVQTAPAPSTPPWGAQAQPAIPSWPPK